MADKPQVSYSVTNPAYAQQAITAGGLYPSETKYRDWTPLDGLTVKRVEGGFIVSLGNQTRVCGDMTALHALLTSLMG
jgi:hypothetical protein